METDRMIRELRRTAKKHEKDIVFTGQTNIFLMCTDVANRLEELDNENKDLKRQLEDIKILERRKEDDGK